MGLKSWYKRFRTWQKEPVTFKCQSTSSNTCVNCGNVYEGDFCPVCGQKYDLGKASWKIVINDFMNFGGVDTKSFISFLVQMLGRPGYLISDYINGRRQVSKEPITLLCFMAVFTALAFSLFGGSSSDTAISAFEGKGLVGFILNFLSSNLDWAIIIETALLIFPTWLLFRFSPRNSHHSFPAGIYIQLFMASLVLFIMFLRALVGTWILALIPLYYYITYHQLFGYGIWGTLWRTFICLGSIVYFFGVAMMVSTRLSNEFWDGVSTWGFIGMFLLFLALGVFIIWLGWWIGKKTERTN